MWLYIDIISNHGVEEVLGWGGGGHFWSAYTNCCLSYCVASHLYTSVHFFTLQMYACMCSLVLIRCHLQCPDVHVHGTNQALVEGVGGGGACVATP